MQPKAGLKLALIVLLVVVLLPTMQPAYAITTAIGRLYTNCSNFSVDVAVNGVNNDGNNLDKFRYQIIDGANKVLYQEDATRQVGVTTSSLVVNMPFSAPPPTKNPIIFSVIDLDANNNTTAIVRQLSYDADCMTRSGTATFSGDFRPPQFLKSTFVANTPIYQSPGGGQLNLSITAGKEHYVVYRSADGQWVAVDVGGNQLVWVPVNTLSVDVNRLNTPPTRIDLSDPTKTSAPGPAPVPGNVVATGRVTTSLRLRAAPSLRAAVYTKIPANTMVPVYGRNKAATFVKVSYNNLTGWVSSGFVFLVDNKLRSLPVVE
jgi:hypothetical protein